MTESAVVIAALVFLAGWMASYKRGYENGQRDVRKLPTNQIQELKDISSDPPQASR